MQEPKKEVTVKRKVLAAVWEGKYWSGHTALPPDWSPDDRVTYVQASVQFLFSDEAFLTRRFGPIGSPTDCVPVKDLFSTSTCFFSPLWLTLSLWCGSFLLSGSAPSLVPALIVLVGSELREKIMEGFEPSSSAHVTHYPLLLLHLLTHCTSFTTLPPLFSFDLAIIGIFCTELCLVPFPKDHRPRPTLFTFILLLWSFFF